MSELINYEILRDKDKLAMRASEVFLEIASEAIEKRGIFRVALSGGSTPRATFQELAKPHNSRQINWEKVQVFWSDERMVAPEDRESNFRMASETLLDLVPIKGENIHRMRGEMEAARAAEDYSQSLAETFGKQEIIFDLILLGLGADGHTASLFPDSRALDISDRPVAENYIDKYKQWRLTFTFATLNAARHILFLVAEADKAAIVSKIVGERESSGYPASKVRPKAGKILWLLDEEAGAQLKVQ